MSRCDTNILCLGPFVIFLALPIVCSSCLQKTISEHVVINSVSTIFECSASVCLALNWLLWCEVLVLLRISYASALLSPRLHMLLWRHGIPAALLRGLLLLEVSLVLHCLLLVGGHVWRLRLSLLHALRRHGLRHRRRRRLLLFWRVDSGLSIDAIRVAGIRSIQARLPWLLARFDQCEVSVCIDVAYLDQILAFGLRDKWLKLGCRECVDQTSL